LMGEWKEIGKHVSTWGGWWCQPCSFIYGDVVFGSDC
jgi:hypothetical protein